VPDHVEEELRGYLECGILCFGFGRALCTGCGQGFVIAFSLDWTIRPPGHSHVLEHMNQEKGFRAL